MIAKLFFVSLILLTSNVIKCQQEQDDPAIFDKLYGIRIRFQKDIKSLLQKNDLVYLQFAYLPSSPKARKAVPEINKAFERLEGLAGLMVINCESFEPRDTALCQEYYDTADSFPKIKLLVPPKKRFDIKTKQLEEHFEMQYNEGDINDQRIYKFITDNMPSHAVSLNSQNEFIYLNNDLFNKVILFSERKQQTVVFRGLTNLFYDRIVFATVSPSETELVKKYNVTSYPTLLIHKSMEKDRLFEKDEIIYFTKEPTIQNLKEFIEPYCLPEKRYVSYMRGKYEEDKALSASRIKIRNLTEKDYKEFFEKFKNDRIMLYFNKNDKIKTPVKKYLILGQ